MKRVADAPDPPVVIPIVVVAVDVHVVLVIPAVERDDRVASHQNHHPLNILRIESHLAYQCLSSPHQVSSIF